MERRAGLYGELHVLRTHLGRRSRRSRSPLGRPSGAHQDFQAAGWALEVKTSRTKQPVSVRISGERQLDDVGLDFLGLAHIGLEQRRQERETLPEIVRSVRGWLPTHRRRDVRGAADCRGLPRHSRAAIPRRRSTSYGSTNCSASRAGFPRITERDLPRASATSPIQSPYSALGGLSESRGRTFTDLMKPETHDHAALSFADFLEDLRQDVLSRAELEGEEKLLPTAFTERLLEDLV